MEIVSSASEKLLESNGHFLRAKMLAEQRASDIMKLQELVAAHVKENNDLKVELSTVK